LIIVVVTAASLGGYVYVAPALFPAHRIPMTVIHIPPGSSRPPSNWHENFTNPSSSTFQYPVTNVVIGVNNTIEWINDDSVAHTVTSFQVPLGAPTFNSDLVFPGKTFTTTLTVLGVYKYFCAWHNWLGGEVTVQPA
jgi:plastocyanin